MDKLEVIREATKMSLEVDITIVSRNRHIILARQIYYKLCRDLTKESLDRIGEVVGKDHATVMWGLKGFDVDIIHREQYYRTYQYLKRTLADKFDENYQVGEAATIVDLLGQLEVERVKNQIGTVLADDEQKLMDLWRSLNTNSKESVMFKVETAFKVQKALEPEACTNPDCVDGYTGEVHGEKIYCRTCKH
tara:strand:- start:4530 stop:5105 length:576 start_codon:yes stop_codon:yes gene_type:complete